MLKTLEVDILSVYSIRKLQKELREYKKSLKYKAELLAERLSQKGVEIACVQVQDMKAIFTGELIESINYDKEKKTAYGAIFVVKADSKHAVYVELGTGRIGAETPYPGKLPVVYGQGGQPSHFVTLEKPFGKYPAGTYGWFYYRDGKLYFTEGMPSRPFMYNMTLELAKEVSDIAKEVFAE